MTNWRQYIIYIGFVCIFAIFAVTLSSQGFLNPNNLLNIVRQSAMIAVMAVAMTFVLAAGEIDLSVGSLAGFSSVVTAMTIRAAGMPAGIAAGFATGAAVGFFNGLITTRIGIPSFLTTLAMMGISTGLSMWVSNTAAIPIINRTYAFIFGGGNLGPVPILLLWTLLFGVVGHLVLKKTTFGRRVLATGGNEIAARYSGINTRSIWLRVLMISSMTAAIAGMLYVRGRLETGRYQFGQGDELSVIAAAVLGSAQQPVRRSWHCRRRDRRELLMIGLINNGLILMGLEYSQQLIARGAIIILAVALSQSRK